MSEGRSSSIQQVNSCPEYIHTFIQHNLSKLHEIYDAGYEANDNEGCLGLICNQDDNKMDVMFMNVETITSMLTSDSWENLKLSIPAGKKLFFVKDEGMGAVFLLYM
jgi:hypothetical protein